MESCLQESCLQESCLQAVGCAVNEIKYAAEAIGHVAADAEDAGEEDGEEGDAEENELDIVIGVYERAYAAVAASMADASQADASMADASQADASQADASQADASQADASQADADASQADASQADASLADRNLAKNRALLLQSCAYGLGDISVSFTTASALDYRYFDCPGEYWNEAYNYPEVGAIVFLDPTCALRVTHTGLLTFLATVLSDGDGDGDGDGEIEDVD